MTRRRLKPGEYVCDHCGHTAPAQPLPSTVVLHACRSKRGETIALRKVTEEVDN